MDADANLVAKIHGGFSLRAGDGTNLTPRGAKERGILALLLLQPEQRRLRSVLQDMLWANSPPEKGASNLRRALSNIRSALGDQAWRLRADRSMVCFDPFVTIAPAPEGKSVLLEDIDIKGAEFERWIADQRQEHGHTEKLVQTPRNHPTHTTPNDAPVVRIQAICGNETTDEEFLTDRIASGIGERLQTLGDLSVHLVGSSTAKDHSDGADTLVTMRTVFNGDKILVHLRIQALPTKRFMAALHMQIARKDLGVSNHPDIVSLVNRSVRAIVDHNAPKARILPFYAIQNAVRRIFSGDRALLLSAESILLDAQATDATGLALAWRGFLRLTEAVEFRNTEQDTVQAALEMSQEATKIAPNNAVVWALAAQVHLNLGDDLDLGIFCARRALECIDDDPYALDAMSSALGILGDTEQAHKTAERALKSAAGLSNEFSWDMQCCLTALGLGKTDDAIRHARDAHLKVPTYRPAVRYLAALNLANGNAPEASKYVSRLKKLEPDFTADLITAKDYPLFTAHRLGITNGLDTSLIA